MKTIETSKGKFKVKSYENWNESITDANYYKLKLGQHIFKLSEITEKQASEIVEEQFGIMMVPLNFINYNLNETGYTAIQSVYSLLESQGIEITNNTYIFEV